MHAWTLKQKQSRTAVWFIHFSLAPALPRLRPSGESSFSDHALWNLPHTLPPCPPGGAAVVWQSGPPLLQGEQEPSSSTGTELHPVYVFPVHASLGPRLISCRPKHIILVWFFLICGWSMMRSKNADMDVRRDEAFFNLKLFGPHQLRRWGCSR